MAKTTSVTFKGDPRDGETIVTDMRRVKDRLGNWEEVPIKKTVKADNPEKVSAFGMEFPLGKAVKIDPDSEFWKAYGQKFEGNSHFDVKHAAAPKGDDDKKAVTPDMPGPQSSASRA